MELINDRYTIIDKIASGGMGEVFRARDEHLHREVAVKILHASHLMDDHFLRRFEREAHLVAGLEHPHIVPLYDYGAADAGRPYLVMQLIRGETLASMITRLSLEQVWRIVEEITGALMVAHKADIIHRDIKPSNILIGHNGYAYLTDFGIARSLTSETRLTGANIIGTPAYMSPEQCRANGQITKATDQYSLAVVIYQMLAKEHLFTGDTMQVMYQHLNEKPSLSKLAEMGLPVHIIQALRIALAKVPADRFESIDIFKDALIYGRFPKNAQRSPRPTKKPTPKPVARQATPPSRKRDTQRSPAKRVPKKSPTNRGIRSRPAPPPPRDLTAEFPTPEKVAAGAARAASSRPPRSSRSLWRWLGGGLFLIAMLGIGATFLFGDRIFPAEAPSPTTELAAGPASPTPADVEATTAEPAAESTEAPTIPPEPTPITVAALAGGISVSPGDLKSFYQNGRIMLPATDFLVTLSSGQAPIAVENQLGAIAQLSGPGVMVVDYSHNPYRMAVHCIEGECQVDGDVGGQLMLGAGEQTIVGASGEPQPAQPSDRARFAEQIAAVPTKLLPTATALPATPTATAPPATEDSAAAESVVTRRAAAELTAQAGTAEAEDAATETPAPTKTEPPATETATPGSNSSIVGAGDGMPIRFENDDVWGIGAQKNGSFTRSDERARSGSASGKLSYRFETGENDFVVFLQQNITSGNPNAFTAWVFGDGAGHFFNIWIQDSGGEIWALPMGRVTHTGWRQMTGYVDPTQDWPWAHISGPDDGVVDYPISFYAVVLDDLNNAYTGSGVIYIDDIETTTVDLDSVQQSSQPAATTAPDAVEPTPTAGGAAAAPTTAAVSPDGLGRILFTSGSTIYTTDPTWTTAEEVGPAVTTTCQGFPSLADGTAFSTYRGSLCSIGQPNKCGSPNGAKEVLVNRENDQFTINLRNSGDEGFGDFVYGGPMTIDGGLQWSPNSLFYMWLVDNAIWVAPGGGGSGQGLYGPARQPVFSLDGTQIVYIGPGNDIYVGRVDGSGQINVTNSPSLDKQCPVWLLNP